MRRSTPLRWAVVLTLLLGLLAPGIAMLVFERRRAQDVVMDDLRLDLQRGAQVLALSMVEPLWQVTPELARPLLEAQFEDPRFVVLRLQDASGGAPMVELKRNSQRPEMQLQQRVPIQRDGRELGSLEVTMSAEPLMARAQADFLQQIGRTALLAAVSMVLIVWLLRRRVVVPLERLAANARNLGQGELERPLPPPSSGDEIGHVNEAMEQMRRALLAAFERLRGYAGTLEEQVNQRTAELTLSNDTLKRTVDQLQTAQRELVESEKLASLGRLVAGVAHELNTPLGNALTVVSTLEDRWQGLANQLGSGEPLRRSQLDGVTQDTRRGLDILHRNVARAAQLVRDFKQVAVDQTSDARRSFELADVVRDVLVMVEPRFKSTPYRLVTDLAAGLTMNSYPGSLGQVLTNLLINALVHGLHERDRGGVLISCAASETPGWVRLSVRDDGVGMDENVRKRIFDPFFTTKLGRGGTGLGMHIVHGIVTQLLGGSIEVESSPGHGAEMRLHLPVVAPERKEAEDTGTD